MNTRNKITLICAIYFCLIFIGGCKTELITKNDLIGIWFLKGKDNSGILIDEQNGMLYETSFTDYNVTTNEFAIESDGCFLDLIILKEKQAIEYTCLTDTYTYEITLIRGGILRIGKSKYEKKTGL